MSVIRLPRRWVRCRHTIEMHKVATNAGAVSSLASYLLYLNDANWTDWEIDFLGNMSGWTGLEPITSRQREKLFELRDDATNYSTLKGYSVANLLRGCWLAHLDLDEDDPEFIVRLYEQRVTSLKRRPIIFTSSFCRSRNELTTIFPNSTTATATTLKMVRLKIAIAGSVWEAR
jgi:hypothetical protein